MLVAAMLPALRPTCCCLARERSRLSSWDLFGGFAEELKISQDSVINDFIACELLSTETGCVAGHLAAELTHVLQKKRPVTGGALISQGQQPPVQSAP
jgi:hypothetical protein